MRYAPLNLLGGTNVDVNRPWTVEDTVNYIPQVAPSPGARTPHEFRDAPGLKPYVKMPDAMSGPIRGSHDCEGSQFVVSGATLFQITNSGVALPIGTIPGTQRVSMAHNQIVGGNQVIVSTGTPNGYVFNTYTKVFGRITDPGYPGGGSVDYIDTYIVSVEPFGRYWFWSAQADATNYNTLDRTEAEADPDAIVGLAVNAFEVVVFGKQTVEFFYNAGGINGNAFKSKRVVNGHGCAARDSIVKLDNTLFWLGVDGIVYRLNGYQAQPVTSPQFTQAIAGKNWAKAFAFSYEDQGHVIYYITFPDGQTFGYDVTSGLTVRRESYGLSRWRLNTLTNCNGRWIGGDFQYGRLYDLDWKYPMESEGDALVRERVTGVNSDNQNKIEIPLLELLFQSGSPQVEPVIFPEQPDPPTITGSAPDGQLGEAYAGFSYTLTGDSPLKVTMRSGVLPQGLEISSAGVINTDETTLVGVFPFTLRVTDRHGLWAEHTDDIKIVCQPGDVGAAITDTLTIPDSYKTAYIYPLANDNLGVAYAADGVAVGGFYHTREYDSDLVQVGATVDIEWMAGSIGDSRLWLRGVNEDGLGLTADDSSGFCKLFDTGVYQGYYQPDYTATVDYSSWWYAEAGWAPEYGGLVWFGPDADNVECVYIGVRKTGTTSPPPNNYVENVILKFPLTGGAATPQLEVAQSVGTTTNPRFWMTRSRDKMIYAITQDGNLMTYDADLVLQSTVALTFPVTGTGNTLRGFGVDGDVLALVYEDGGVTAEGRIEFRNLLTQTFISSISSANVVGREATRVLFTDDSCYVQCRNWVGRIEFSPPTCVLP